DSRLEACGIVEKPSTAGEHQHGLSLSLQENDRLLFLGIREQPASVALEKLLEDARAGVEEHGDPVIAGRPEILQERRGLLFAARGQLIPQPVQSLAQRRPPGLAPLGVEARLAVAVALPAIQTVRTAPGASLHDFDLVDWRAHLEKLAIVGQLRDARMLDGVEDLRQNDLSAPIVMAVRSTLASHMAALATSHFVAD